MSEKLNPITQREIDKGLRPHVVRAPAERFRGDLSAFLRRRAEHHGRKHGPNARAREAECRWLADAIDAGTLP